MIRRLEGLSYADRARAGGKGAALGELLKQGIPVPPGFVVCTDAFQIFLETGNLEEKIKDAFQGLRKDDQEEIRRVASLLTSLLLKTNIPSSLVKEIYAAFDELDVPFVAVRSSATVEDGVDAAWAGQLESSLNRTRDQLIDAIKYCWASLFSPRAIVYCLEQGLEAKDIAVAVVVQRMVQSEAAGVAFSAHPVTHARDQVLIEAGYGLGEAVVSGQITPDTYMVEKVSRSIQILGSHRQTQGLFRTSSGETQWSRLPAEYTEKRVLAEAEIQALTKLVLVIESHFGIPVDIEWAKEGTSFFIVQTRPITTLAKTFSSQTGAMDEREIRQKDWCYYVTRRFNWFVQSVQLRAMQADVQNAHLGFSVPTQNYLLLDGDEYFCEEDGHRSHEQFLDAFTRDPLFFQQFAQKEEQIIAETETYSSELRRTDFSSHSPAELITALERFSEQYLISFLPAWMRPDTFLEFEVQKRLREEFHLSEEEVKRVFRMIATPLHQHLAYADEPLALLLLAKRIEAFQGSLEAPSEIIETLLRQHAEAYGWMKGPVFPELRSFSLEDYRERLAYLLRQPLQERIQHTKRIREERDVGYRAFLKRCNPSGKLRHLCQALRAFMWLRTRTTEVSDQLFFWGRKTLFVELSQRLALSAEEVVMLAPDEIISVLSGKEKEHRALICGRTQAYAIIVVNGQISVFMGQEARSFARAMTSRVRVSSVRQERVLSGFCASPGVVQGIVRVLLTPDDTSSLLAGEILVATMTLPEYTAAMERAAAFVTDEGGITCHAAIIAREMGKPCVIGTGCATQMLRTGERIEVDAIQGVIRRLEEI